MKTKGGDGPLAINLTNLYYLCVPEVVRVSVRNTSYEPSSAETSDTLVSLASCMNRGLKWLYGFVSVLIFNYNLFK